MHINCPHCYNRIEVIEEVSLIEIDCPSCGSRFSLLGEDPDATLDGAGVNRTLGRFELVNEVGVGAFGSVWCGKDPQLDRTVAVKIPRKGQLNHAESRQFFREARAAAQLKHPNVVPVHEIGKDGDTIYIVSDFVNGISLSDRLTSGAMEMRECAELCIKICSALHHAHQKGVIHRDLKPANIMLDEAREPHVMDFGLAKRDVGEITMTIDGQILGTPAYMSPEQARGAAHNVDGRSDLYSVGVILFELLTGELPFRGNTRMLLHQVINEDAPSPLKLNPNIDRDLATITSKCLEKEPAKRYGTANELADDLQYYLDGKPVAARPISRFDRGLRWCMRNRAFTVAMSLSILLLVGLAIGGSWTAIKQASLRRKADFATQVALTEKRRANKEAVTKSHMLNIITSAFESVSPDAGANFRMSAKDVLDNVLLSLEHSDLDDLAKARMLATITSSFYGIGEYDSAATAAKQMIALQNERLGSGNNDTLIGMNNLALAYKSMGRMDEAKSIIGNVLKKRQLKLGPDHPDTLTSKNNLGLVLISTGQIEEAIDLFETVLEKRKEKLGHSHNDTITTMDNLASAYRLGGRFGKANSMYQLAFKKREASLGSDHPKTLHSKNHVAMSFRLVGKYQEALELYDETIRLLKTKVGPDHPLTLSAKSNLAMVYNSIGRFEDAITMNETVLAVKRSKLGENHPDTLTSMNNLALALGKAGKRDKALPLYEETLAKRRIISGADHHDTLVTMGNLAFTYLSVGRVDDAIKLGEEAFSKKKKVLGSSHPLTLETMNNLGMAYHSDGRHDKAIPLFEQSVENMKSKLGVEHPRTLVSMSNLAYVYQTINRQDQAIDLYQEVLEKRLSNFGRNHPSTLTAMKNLGAAYDAAGRVDDAERIFENALDNARTNLGSDNSETLSIQVRLARVLMDKQEFDRSGQYVRDAIRLNERKSTAPWTNFNFRSILGEVLLKQGKFESAEKFLIEGYMGLQSAESKTPIDIRDHLLSEAIKRLIELAKQTDAVEDLKKWETMLESVEEVGKE